MSIDPNAYCDPAFSAVEDAFASNFAELGELGAAVSIRVDGRPVVDLWGGWQDAARTRPWRRDTLVNAYSVGKGLLAVLALTLVERGALSLDRPVTALWPEFGASGKADVTLRMLLAHRGGLPGVRRLLPPDAMLDWDLMCGELAGQAPWWEPGSDHGYHVNTFGYLVGEVIRRATGNDVGAALREVVLRPVASAGDERDGEFWYGLPSENHARCAEVQAPDVLLTERSQWERAFPSTGDAAHDEMIWRSYFNPAGFSGLGFVNTPPWRLAQIPSTNGHGTARAVAAVYQAVLQSASGARSSGVGATLLAEACTPQSDGTDRVLSRPSRFGLGFQLPQESRPIGPNPETFGHFGYGGSLGFGDPVAGVAFGFLTNKPGERWQTPRTQRLIDALYASLA